MRHGDDAMREDGARFEYVHVDAADGVVQVEQVGVLRRDLCGSSKI
jgi:hypothetical protein